MGEYWAKIRKEEEAERKYREDQAKHILMHQKESVFHLGLTYDEWYTIAVQHPVYLERKKHFQQTRWQYLPESFKNFLRKKGTTDYAFKLVPGGLFYKKVSERVKRFIDTGASCVWAGDYVFCFIQRKNNRVPDDKGEGDSWWCVSVERQLPKF